MRQYRVENARRVEADAEAYPEKKETHESRPSKIATIFTLADSIAFAR